MAMKIEKSTLDFLKALKRNNNREWFQKNKERYTSSLENVATWLDELIAEMNKHDRLQTRTGKESLYRIYNDVRFSNDKTPYNPRFAGHFKRVKPELRGGYYFWIKPGESRVGCGFTYPDPMDLLRIRQDIDLNDKDWRKLLRTKTIQVNFGNMMGDRLKTTPKGFAKDHAAIDLLRHKQFWFERSFTDNEVLSSDFSKKINTTYKSIRPFFDYMTDVLTTNVNGESLLR
jgi:uncharacterized protein (TIGR02453 family)